MEDQRDSNEIVRWFRVGGSLIPLRAVPADTLKAWSEKVGGWEKLVNRTSMTWRNLPEDRKTAHTDAQWSKLIAEYPALVRRPVTVTPDGEVTVGFSEKRYGERFA